MALDNTKVRAQETQQAQEFQKGGLERLFAPLKAMAAGFHDRLKSHFDTIAAENKGIEKARAEGASPAEAAATVRWKGTATEAAE